jgi:hypothetical protein
LEELMQTTLRAILTAFGTGALGVSVALATPGGRTFGSKTAHETAAEQVQYWRGSYCERLRRACVYKEYRDEVGEGNCRRYRAECGGGSSYCERLRRACAYKEYRGEVGEGNCRRYRDECGGY